MNSERNAHVSSRRTPTTVRGVAWNRFLDLGRDEGGAVFVVTLAFFFLMYLVCCGVYAVSTAVRERIQLQNACDAAAYSAAVVQADTLSRIATINRAMAWTYVQMTRRQMDYIVLKWLKHTVDHYETDRKGAREYNRGGIFGSPCGGHASIGTGWYIGTDAKAGSGTANMIRLNGWTAGLYKGTSNSQPLNLVAANNGQVVSFDRLKMYVEAKKGSIGVLATDIDHDKETIGKMNKAEKELAEEMSGRISSAVHDVVCANLPKHMQKGCCYLLRQSGTSKIPSYFRFLGNNPEGEIHFLSFADYTESLIDVFMKSEDNWIGKLEDYAYSPTGEFVDLPIIRSRIAAGFDQWFVRGDGDGRTDGNAGLQRCYKHWAEGPYANIHPSHAPLPPSCWNTDEDVLHGSPATVALYSDWVWWSDVRSCPKVFFHTVHLHCLHKRKGWPKKIECDHNGKPGLFGADDLRDLIKGIEDFSDSIDDIENLVKSQVEGRTDADGNAIEPTNADVETAIGDAFSGKGTQFGGFNESGEAEGTGYGGVPIGDYESTGYGESKLKQMSGNIEEFHDGCLITYPVLNGTSHMVGYGRLYADSESHDGGGHCLYDDRYIGAKALPLILGQNYFGEDGTITVGIVRRNQNVWERILGAIDGVFRAFDPDWTGDVNSSKTFVFASAKAGYVDKTDDRAADAQRIDYRIDWQTGNQKWNLCQGNWDAVFVPVRMSNSMAVDGKWQDADDRVLEDLIGNASWRSLDGNQPSGIGSWQEISAPRLMNGVEMKSMYIDGFSAEQGRVELQYVTDRDKAQNLNWRGLSRVLYH